MVIPGGCYMVMMSLCGTMDLLPLPALLLGGAVGMLLPGRPPRVHRRGETGAAQVRLELGAEVLSATRQLILEMKPPPIDREALLERARNQACGQGVRY